MDQQSKATDYRRHAAACLEVAERMSLSATESLFEARELMAEMLKRFDAWLDDRLAVPQQSASRDQAR